MADITYNYIDKKHLLTSYDAVIDACSWIESALIFACKEKDIKGVSCYISFSSGAMSYQCHSLDEFKEYAFGKSFELKDLYIGLNDTSIFSVVSVFAKLKDEDIQGYTITSQNETIISNVVEALRTEAKIIPQNSIETVNVNYEDNSIHIGDGTTITSSAIGQNNKIESTPPQKEKLPSKIIWNVIVPIVVGVVVVAVCVWLGLQSR